MTAKELRDKESSHLSAELLDKQRNLYDLRSQAVTEKLEDPSQLRKAKKDIARIKTVLRQRELEQMKKTAASATSEKKEAKSSSPQAKKTRSRKSATAKA
jgi:large subunit ribosomal protein L29